MRFLSGGVAHLACILPIAQRTVNYKDIVRSLQAPHDPWIDGVLLMGATVFGYTSLCANKVFQGKELPDPEDPKIW